MRIYVSFYRKPRKRGLKTDLKPSHAFKNYEKIIVVLTNKIFEKIKL